VRALILENNPETAALLESALSAYAGLTVQIAESGEALRHALCAGAFDLLLCDHDTPDFNGAASLALRNEICPDVPIVIVADSLSEEAALQLFREGVTECLLKNQLARLDILAHRALLENAERKERERMQETARQRTNLLQLQQVIAAAANEAATLDDALQAGVDLICAYAGFQIGHAYLFDPSSDALTSTGIWYLRNSDEHREFVEATEALPFGSGYGLPGHVLAKNAPIWIESLAQTEDFRRHEIAEKLGIQSGIALPASSGKQVLAVLEFYSNEYREHDQRLLDVMLYVGTQLSRVIERERAEQELMQRERRHEAIAKISQRALEESDLDKLLDEATALAADVLKVDHCAVLELCYNSDAFVARSVFPAASSFTRQVFAVSPRLVGGYTALQRKPTFVLDLATDARFDKNSFLSKMEMVSGLATPISMHDRQLGVMTAFSKQRRNFSERDAEFLQTISNVLASALERNRATSALRLLNSAIEQTRESIIVTDANLRLPGPRILFVNEAFTKLTGYSGHQVLGFSPRLLQGNKTARDVIAKMQEALSHDEHFDGEAIHYRRDGSEFWMEWHIAPVRDSAGAITQFFWILRDVTARKQAEDALRESQERFRGTFEQAAVGIAHVALDGYYIRVNQRFCDMLGYSREELQQKRFHDVTHPDDIDLGPPQMHAMLKGEMESWSGEKRYLSKDGSTVWGHVTARLLRDDEGNPNYFITVVEDISDRKRLEQQYLQAQKMDAFGRLAGGVAHDFNNLLTVISGYNSMMLESLPHGDPRRENAEEVGKAADRAAALTNQLLAFSRQQVLQPKIFNLNTVLEGVEKMLRRIIGEDIELVTELDPELGQVRADISQIENVLMNMSVNARDAMLHGGTLTIRTANFTATEKDAERVPGMKPGDYITIAMSDTGIGMSESVKAHIFEPFFTTKPVGHGTGLGLATCYGIVSQSSGHIAVDSELGRGATFTIYLPRTAEEQEEVADELEFGELPGGTETILVVEDDPLVRKLTMWVLRALGYRLHEAANGEEAFNLMQTHADEKLDMVITDVVMPQMSGKDLAFWIRASQPEAKILFVSGYPNNELDDIGALAGGVDFLRKPFAPKELAHKIRTMLDNQESNASL